MCLEILDGRSLWTLTEMYLGGAARGLGFTNILGAIFRMIYDKYTDTYAHQCKYFYFMYTYDIFLNSECSEK